MKKLFTLIASVLMVLPLMAIGDNSGKTKPDAKDFTWDKPMTQDAGTQWVWYVVDLSPLYEQDNPALKLYLTNVNSEGDATVDLEATVAGQTEKKTYTIGAKQTKEWSANASTLVRMKQKEIYLTLKTTRKVQLSAKVFEAADLNDLCKVATPLDWTNGFERGVGDVEWFKVDLTNAKKTSETRDVQVAITNKGTKTMRLYAGQSLDCPSSGVTLRVIEVAAGETKYDTVPNSMIKAVAGDELYVSIENTQKMSLKASFLEPPVVPVPPIMDVTDPWEELHITDTFSVAKSNVLTGKHYFRISVADMDSLTKYEPEFTFRNEGTTPVTITRKMAFAIPATSAQGDQITLAPGEETIEVIKKNTVEGLTNESIYVYINSNAPVSLFGRFKHVREGKACKTNIDFDWVKGHEQPGHTTQWYAIDVREAKRDVRDIKVTIENQGTTATALKASIAFSCPYIDLQEFNSSIAAGKTASKTLGYAAYAMMSDTIYVGLETSQPIKITADTLSTVLPPKDDACLTATMFDWTDGGAQKADTAIWYKIDMRKVRNQQSYPTVVVTNLSETASAVIEGRLSLECPDSLPDQVRTLTIPAGGVYEKQLSRNMFENIKNDSVYIRVASNQAIKFEVRRQAVPAGSDCASAIRFNWVSGNDQKANANLWYVVDLSQAIREKKDVKVTIKNKDAKNACEGSAWISYSCPDDATPQTQAYKLAAGATKSYTFVNSSFSELASDSIYIRLIGSTELHISGELVNQQPFDTIQCADILPGIHEFVWDSTYTQLVDTAWYMIAKSELNKFVGTDLAPKVYLKNLTGTNNNVKVEAAFACPIEQTMMGKSQTLTPNQSLSKQIARTTIEQYLSKDVVYLRVIQKGGIEFKAAKEDPNTGNDCMSARPVRLTDTIAQAANTVMWYRINTADLKKDATLHGKSLSVHVNGSPTKATTIKVGVYEDCAGEDLLDERGKRTIAAGKSTTRNIPAYVIYGLADKDLFIRIETDQPINWATSLSDYAALTPVKDLKSIAKTASPNVTYTLKANEENWFAVCLPQMRNNYVLTDSAKFYVENPNGFEVKVTGTATWQDQLSFQIPERTRSISANRKVYKPFKQCIDRAIKRAGFNYSIEDTETSYIDSLARAFITEDSLTMYVMLKPTAPLLWGIMMDKANGDICDDAIVFDWEHGNVHPAGDTLWYRVQIDSLKIPEDKDLRIHIESWGDTTQNTILHASLYFDCNESATKTKTDTILVRDSIDADRDLLETVRWADLLIQYTSSQPTYMWVELIDTMPRQIDRDTVRALVCNGTNYLDTVAKPNVYHKILNVTQIWSDTVSWRDGVQMRDSITLFVISPILMPDSLEVIDSIYALNMGPQIEVAKNLSVDASSKQLTAWMKAVAAADDSIAQVDTVYWAKPYYDSEGDIDLDYENPVDTSYIYTAVGIDSMLLVIQGYCDVNLVKRYPVEFMIQPASCTNDTVWATVPTVACDSFYWDKSNLWYKTKGTNTYYAAIEKPKPYCGDSVYELILDLGYSSPIAPDTAILCADSYTWNNRVYTASGDYDSLFVNGDGCDSLAMLHLVLNPSYFAEEAHSACNEYTWHGTRYIKSGVYYDSLLTVAGCDSVYKLTLSLTYDQYEVLPAVAKYGNLIVLIDKHKIDSMTHWDYTEEDVVWYKVGQIAPIATGYYYATGKPLTGSYYAVIKIEDDGGCAKVGTTVVVNCDAVTGAPQLVPSFARPDEQMQLRNLDPEQVTTVRVFSTEGRLLQQFTVTNESTFLMPAQKESGFYMVEVITENDKTTLRYIVK